MNWSVVGAWPRICQGWERPTAIVLIFSIAVIHFAYLLRCPLELAPDEAHYWDWSRHLDWSYYSKGPLVAWIIRLSCELFGSLSERLVGSPMLAIRLPAILFGALSLVASYILTFRITKSDRIVLYATIALVTMPMTSAGSTFMTIDSPFVCLWAWALVFVCDALFEGKNWAWPLAGLLVGLGILAKYTMVLWIGGLFCFLITTPYRREFLKPGVWIAGLIAGVCCIPIVIWNIQHDWITLRHVGTQAGTSATSIRWFGPIRYVVEQMGLLMIVWFFPFACAMWANKPTINRNSEIENPKLLYWWMSAVVFGTFLLATFKSPGQINWPIAAYVSGFVLAFDWLAPRMSQTVWRRNIYSVAIISVILTFSLHFPAIMRTPLSFVADLFDRNGPCPIRRLDPTVRLRGWKFLATEIDRLREQIYAGGDDPLIVTTFWNLTGEIAFHCEGRPNVYCFGPAAAQRMSQYDLWRPNPLWDPNEFAGRTLILVGDPAPELAAGFDCIESTRKVTYCEAGIPICYWNLSVARGYRGYGPPNRWPGGPKF